MQSTANLWLIVPALGFALAFAFGVLAHRTAFCTMGAVSDVVNMGDWSRMRMWLLAIAVAILGANLIALLGWVELGKSLYTGERLSLVSHIVGGFLFGVGMTLASGCGSRNLIRLAAGNLKSLVVLLFLGITAFMTMKGLLAPLRVHLLDPIALYLTGGQDLPNLLHRASGVDIRVLRSIVAGAIGAALVAFVLRDRAFRANREYLLCGIVVGLVIAAGWYVTGHIGHLAEDPETLEEAFVGTDTKRPESFSYVGPVAYSLQLLLLWTDKSLRMTFGVAIVVGLFSGALLNALWTGASRWEGFASAADLRNHILGGILMGFGGVTALGCTIGQGLSGVSTLALGSFVALGSIIAGCAATNVVLYKRMLREG